MNSMRIRHKTEVFTYKFYWDKYEKNLLHSTEKLS
jgi:hypothetical protein